MTFQHKDMGGFRQLESSELERVSGGGSDDALYNFKALDVNSDGAITGAEMAAAQNDWTDDDFSAADSNNDGTLNEAELARLIVVSATPEQVTAAWNQWSNDVNFYWRIGGSLFGFAVGTVHDSNNNHGIFLGIAKPGIVAGGGVTTNADASGFDADTSGIYYQSPDAWGSHERIIGQNPDGSYIYGPVEPGWSIF